MIQIWDTAFLYQALENTEFDFDLEKQGHNTHYGSHIICAQ